MKNTVSTTRILLSILATGIMIFCGMVIETAMNIVFPTLMKEFDIGTSTVQWMTTSYLLVVSMIVPISSYLKNQFKTKHLFLFAICFFIVGVLIDSVAGTFPILLLGRIIQGIGTGVALPLMFNIIIDEVPAEKMGIMMAAGTLVTAIGPAIGPTVGGLISFYLDWHYIFILLLPLLIISFVLGIIVIPQSAPIVKRPFSFDSYIFIPIMFIGFVVCLSQISRYGIVSWEFFVPFVIGILGMIGFTKRSFYQEKPLLNLKIFKNRQFSMHVVAFMFIQMTLLGLGFLLPNFSQIVLHKSSLIAAVQLLAGAIIGALFTVFSGRILDNYGAGRPVKIGTCIIVITLAIFTFLAPRLTIPLIAIIYGLFMLGVGLALGNIMTNGIKVLSVYVQSDGNAVFNVVQQFAGAVGTTLASTVVSVVQKGQMTSRRFVITTATGTQIGFLVLLALVCLSFVLMWFAFNQATQESNA